MPSTRCLLWFVAALILILGSESVHARTVERINVSSVGEQANGSVEAVAVSADGRFVAFESGATNLVAGDSNGRSDIFVRDRAVGTTVRASVSSEGVQGNLRSFSPSISMDGRYVAFVSAAENLVPDDTNAQADVFVRDLQAGTTVRVSVDSFGAQANERSVTVAFSPNGRFVFFSSLASNLSAGDTNNRDDIFAHDLVTGLTTLVSTNAVGVIGDSGSSFPASSFDGRYVAFVSDAANLVSDDTNHVSDIFVKDRQSGHIERVSVDSDGGQADSFPSVQGSFTPAISGDGRFVAFSSGAVDLAPESVSGHLRIFVHDRQTGQTLDISKTFNGRPADSESTHPSMSLDGAVVAFDSSSRDLVPNDSNQRRDIFIRCLSSSSTSRVSVGTDGAEGNLDSFNPQISANGRAVAFLSSSSNLVSGDTNATIDAFISVSDGVSLTSVFPAMGSEAGGDRVKLAGSGFSDAPDTIVTIGGTIATILDVAEDHLDIITPPGAGLADIAISGSSGCDQLPHSFQYVAPSIAARAGNVNAGNGSLEDVLRVNGSIGDPLTREVSLAVGAPFEITMSAPSTTHVAPFVLYLWVGPPTDSSVTVQPFGFGRTVFPTPLTGFSPQPRFVWNNLGFFAQLGSPNRPSTSAPSVVIHRSNGQPHPTTITLQGFVVDRGSQNDRPLSITNAVIIRVE